MNAYSNNHDLIASGKVGSLEKIYLHIVDTVALVHALITPSEGDRSAAESASTGRSLTTEGDRTPCMTFVASLSFLSSWLPLSIFWRDNNV